MTRDYVCIDSETCGLFGPIVLFQYGEGDDGPIRLYSPLSNPIRETIDIYRWLTSKRILGFNLAFDWFKVQQQATTLMLLGHRVGLDELPINHIDAYAMCEPEARDGPCLKPLGAMDLMLHARKGPWQNLMARDPITIRRVPIGIATLVLQELESRIKVPDIFFAKRKEKGGTKWKIKRIKNADGENPDFVDIVLDFKPSSALKALATHELNLDPMETLVYSDVEVDRRFLPEEHGFAPFALAIGKPGKWEGAWPDVIKKHHAHWLYHDLAREYALKDIEYPRRLYDKWGRPAFDDDDSILACLAGATRWKGFSVNLEGIEDLRRTAEQRSRSAPRAPRAVLEFLQEKLAPEEQLVLKDKHTGSLTTKKVVLEEIRKLKACNECLAGVDHAVCALITHPAAERANQVLDARKGKKELEVYEKLLLAQRFHVSVNVIGARSSRQSGGQVSEGKKVRKSGGLNPQGIQKNKLIRAQFPLAFTPEIMQALSQSMKGALCTLDAAALTKKLIEQDKVDQFYAEADKRRKLHLNEWSEIGYPVSEELLVGGDFDKFEVCIADAYYEDPQLHEDLTGVEPECTYGECKYSNPVCTGCVHGFHKKACDERGCECQAHSYEYAPYCSKCTGKPSKKGSIKIHAVIGTMAYVGRTYWEIRATDGKEREELAKLFPEWPQEHWENLYTRAKSAFFALIYFGNEDTLAGRLGIPKEDGLKVFNAIMARYPVMAEKRDEFRVKHCPINQPDGGQVFWNDPDDYVESMNGFKRFFTLENQIIRTLYEIAEDVPSEWNAIKLKVMRRDRLQTVAGAVRSSLYGAAFGLQGANMRAAGNHKIQATGAIETKELQCEIWTLQPCGIHPWLVRPMNVHDELPSAVVAWLEEKVGGIQAAFIKKKQKMIRLLKMKWKRMGTWAGK